MYDTPDATRLHREELDREIEAIRTERLLRAGSGSPPGLAKRARAGLGRRFIAIGTALVGPSEPAGRPAPKASPAAGGRA